MKTGRVSGLFAAAMLAGCGASPAGPNAPAPAASTAPERATAPAVAPRNQARAVPHAAPALGFLKGQTHVHSAGSYDAKTPVEEVLRFYAERGYDFIAITDHNRVTSAQSPTAELLVVSGVEITQNSALCQPPAVAGYRCLFHTSALFIDPALDPARGGLFTPQFHTGRRQSFESQIELSRKLGGVAVLNHPLFHFAADAALLSTLSRQGLRLLEVINASLDQQHPDGRERAEQRVLRLWDEALSRGAELYGIASDDAHHFSDASERKKQGKFAYVGDRAWVMVRAEKQPAAIRRALLAGDFYASTGVSLRRLNCGASSIELEVEPVAGKRYTTRFIGRGGAELSRVEGNQARFELQGDELYVRAVVESDDGEVALVQPVFPQRQRRPRHSNHTSPSSGAPRARSTGIR